MAPALLAQADGDALNASIQNAAMPPTQTFGTISHATTVTGNGGLNVIAINGGITSGLTLSGSANDVFVVNVTGNALLVGNATLGLSGAVTADHVLYNFTGARSFVTVVSTASVNGTLLAPHGTVTLAATVNGGVVAGGNQIALLPGATVRPAAFNPPVAGASLSGGVASQGVGLAGITIVLTGTDANGKTVSFSTVTDQDGNFTFQALPPGNYTLKAPQVAGFTTNTFAGKVNNSYDGTVQLNGDVAGIVLGSSDQATGYFFSEVSDVILDG